MGTNCRGLLTCNPKEKDYSRCVAYFECELGRQGEECRMKHSPNPSAVANSDKKALDH